ncbi:MAG: toll/interleukin-1 receptor domain-containing protein [Nitrospirales bacterium]|nr:toll/interleukin-1 receptor domain-containing protein [Nitrospirales bacterium]
MPNAFLSYARTDLEKVQPLLAELANKGMSIWRDQEKIYGGEQWPKVLGEAIDQHDYFLLSWSKDAALSHFVELEWCTALALKKTIIPIRLDNTPFPAVLRSLEAIEAQDQAKATVRILEATQHPSPQAPHAHREAVLRQLETIPHAEPERVLERARVLFEQQGWMVQGNAYQAGRDLHITNVTFPISKMSLIAGMVLLSIIAIWVAVPWWNGTFTGKDAALMEQELGGSIYNEEGMPMAGVEVSLPKYQKITRTNNQGYWHFKIQGPKQESVEILAQKNPDYTPSRTSGTLGNTNMSFLMDAKHP